MNPFVRFPTQPTRKADSRALSAVYYRRIAVRDGFIEGLTRCKEESASISQAWVPDSIVMVTAGWHQKHLQFRWLIFESNSRLIRIESRAFSGSLESIVIPSNVEILSSSCFSGCKSLTSISFESNSRLTRIEFKAFSYSSLQSIVIPSNVSSINGSAFLDVNLSNCLIESGNQRFVCENDFLIDVVDHKLIRSFSTSSHVEIPCHIEISRTASGCCTAVSKRATSSSMLIGEFKLRTSVRSGWTRAQLNRFRGNCGRRLRMFPYLRPFFLRSQSVQQAVRPSLPMSQSLFCG
jgi:hypothetical protein